MSTVFKKAQNKLERYKKKYYNQPRKAAFKLAFWNLVYAFSVEKKSKILLNENTACNEAKEVAASKRIALYLSGGVGDILIGLNYATYLFEQVSVPIDIFVKNVEMARELLGTEQFTFYYGNDFFKVTQYPLKIKVGRFPCVEYADTEYIAKHMPETQFFLDLYKNFYSKNIPMMEHHPYLDSVGNHYSVMRNQKRIQQADIEFYLGITEDYKIDIPVYDEVQTLAKFGLNEKRFVTFNRGVDSTGNNIESTKMWPYAYYCELVQLIKKSYPELVLVQLGPSEERCKIFDGVDMSLVGKTTLNELKVMLKHSILHIDNEGGMVHLRKALHGGKSIVIFGSTSLEFYGYESNVNIKADGACSNCEWLSRSWQQECGNKESDHRCMKNITPEQVFESVARQLDRSLSNRGAQEEAILT